MCTSGSFIEFPALLQIMAVIQTGILLIQMKITEIKLLVRL